MNWKDLKEINATVEQDDRVPDGYRTVVLKAYSNGEKLVFPEQPEWQRSDDEEDLSHDCDAEGCGSLDHVMRHVPIRRDWEREGRLAQAEALLDRFSEECTEKRMHDGDLWRDYFAFTGRHMILTEEGWCPGEMKKSYIDEIERGEWPGAKLEDFIVEEINAPDEPEPATA